MRRLKYLIVVLGLVVLPVSSFSQNRADEARKYLIRGATALEMATDASGLALAIGEFKKATEIAPDLAAAWYNLGTVQSKAGKFKDAIDSYNRYLTLAPQAADAQKVRDEVTKLEFRLEQAGKFNSLSGHWVSGDGRIALITAMDGKLTIATDLRFPGEYAYSLDGNHSDLSPVYTGAVLEFTQKGNQFTTTLETGAHKPQFNCVAPPQKSEIVASQEQDRLVLRLKRMSFRVVEAFNGTFDIKTHCAEMTPLGTMNVEVVLTPLPSGGISINTPGLQNGDRIISVDGVALASLSGAERARKLRGEPGTTVQLVVERRIEEKSFFSPAKYGEFNVTATLIAVNPAVKPDQQGIRSW
ncbi:MAG TPA: tetratricopeptide repeat protein [Noviherbaspirillum sp.]|nr:tetratricopeptide repeat protein [Noviherbaspirillum sp.]